jgi:hypothetical protein
MKAILVSVKPFLEALTSSRVIAGASSSPYLSLKCLVSFFKDRIFFVPCKQSLIVFDLAIQEFFS